MNGSEEIVGMVLRESMRRNGDPMTHPTEYELDHYESIRAVEVRVMALEKAHASLDKKVDDNTSITNAIKNDTSDLVEFAKTAKGLVTFAKWVGIILKWGSSIAVAFLAVWTYFKGGK